MCMKAVLLDFYLHNAMPAWCYLWPCVCLSQTSGIETAEWIELVISTEASWDVSSPCIVLLATNYII